MHRAKSNPILTRDHLPQQHQRYFVKTSSPAPSQAVRRTSLRLVRLAVAVLVFHGYAGSALAADPLSSDEKLRQFMQHVRPQAQIDQAGGQATQDITAVSPAKLQERAELLKAGETALARLDVNGALDAFEHASLILHSAETEIALVRSYMQRGEYRRALAFGAHTAGSHLDVIGGATLYAWLLHVGGQQAFAQRLLAAAESRMPGNAVVAEVQLQLRSGNPVATGELLAPPTRLAPYGDAKGLPENAQVAGSALLLQSGMGALVPLSLLPRSGKLWLRNGMGQLVKAQLDKPLGDLNVALVRLDAPLPVPEDLSIAAGEISSGRADFAVEYVSTPVAAPAWPVLRTGLLRDAKGDSGNQLLGIVMPAGPRGGPVFDASGRLIGVASHGFSGPATAAADDLLVSVSQLRQALSGQMPSEQLTAQDVPGPRPRSMVEKVYERSLKISLQVITAP